MRSFPHKCNANLNSMNMRISVAMCTYNGEDYLDEQLQSILEQSIPVDEIM